MSTGHPRKGVPGGRIAGFESGRDAGGFAAAAFLAFDAQTLTAFPQAFATDTEFACQLGFGHVVLVFENEVLEVVFQ